MVISKCVPLEISRKKFSQFEVNYSPQNMTFVGWKYDENDLEEDLSKKKKINVQLNYDHLKNDIIRFLENAGEIGDEVYFHKLDETTFDQDAQSHVIDLKKKRGCVELNGGGNYTEDVLYFVNPQIGSLTNIIVDNTGLPSDQNENGFESPTENFVLYYGTKANDDNYEILSVPPWCRGIVQILHLSKNDIVLNATYTDLLEQYIPDATPVIENISGHPFDASPTEDKSNLDIDMKNENGFLEFTTGKYSNYTFWFSNTELGSMSYVVVDNYHGNQKVTLNYAKRVENADGTTGQIISEMTTLEKGEKTIVEIFHSLSVDIISKVIKL